jgi:peptide deformylase
LTFPGLAVKIKRADEIRVRFAMPNGDVRTETFRGLTAHSFQHEMDHMNGELFYMKATKYHRDQAFKNWKK